MLRTVNKIHFSFARSRMRRQMKFEPKLKDLTSTYDLSKQIAVMRTQFETMESHEPFSDVLSQPKPKLGKRFMIDKKALNKKIKRDFNKNINVDLLQSATQNEEDIRMIGDSRSHIFDHSKQLEIQEKMKRELFEKKETNRILKAQQEKYQNYLPDQQGKLSPFLEYTEDKNRLKNSRVESMMGYRRNNEELQLLIESGFIDEPQNIKEIINKISKTRQIEHRTGLSERGLQQNQSSVTETASSVMETPENYDSDSSLVLPSDKNKTEFSQKLLKNITGVDQIRDHDKLNQFLELYESSDNRDRLKTQEDLNLLLKIKQFEKNKFLERYNSINFRFKGEVHFDFMKEPEMLSYLKHSPIEPDHLLAIFEQNKNQVSRFNMPIITPAVMSRIYTRTSLYQFPETDDNNRINMLNHPYFVKLEKSLFRQLDKISDDYFADCVWSYAVNHEEEQGLLNVKRSDAIEKAIVNEFIWRLPNMQEADLGLLARSLVKMTVLTDSSFEADLIKMVQLLDAKLTIIEDFYSFESVMVLISLMQVNGRAIEVIANHVHMFEKYPWDRADMLMAHIRVASSLFRSRNLIPIEHRQKTLVFLRELTISKSEQIRSLIPQISINSMPQLLTHLHQIIQIPNRAGADLNPLMIISSISKKSIVDSILQQKTKIGYTIIKQISFMMALADYQYYLKGVIEYRDNPNALVNPLKVVALRSLLPSRVFKFNSIQYSVYHELGRLLASESKVLDPLTISYCLTGLSLVSYKNEGFYEALSLDCYERIINKFKRSQQKQISMNDTRCLMLLFTNYSLQRRMSQLAEDILLVLLNDSFGNVQKVEPNLLVRFFGSYVNTNKMSSIKVLSAEPSESEVIANKMLSLLQTCSRFSVQPYLQSLELEQLIVWFQVQTVFLTNITEQYSKTDRMKIGQYLAGSLAKILDTIDKKCLSEIHINYRFVLIICRELLSWHGFKDLLENREKVFGKGAFGSDQKEFYQSILWQVKQNEDLIGSNFSYETIYDKITTKLSQQAAVVERPWRIEVLSQNTVYFIASYDHLVSKMAKDKMKVSLFGLWSIYEQLYVARGWKVQIVLAYLQN